MSATVALVAMDCLLPGADGVEEFWELLVSGGDARRDDDERLARGHPDAAHRLSSRRGGFLTSETRAAARAAAGLGDEADDACSWATLVARRALNRVGGSGVDPARTGVFLGCYTFPTERSAAVSLGLVAQEVRAGAQDAGARITPQEAPRSAEPGEVDVAGVVGDTVADALGLDGPRLVLDAACASGLYALRLACDALTTGQADTMVAGSVCAPELSLLHLSFSDLGAYGTGRSAPFRGGTTGITTGEGAAVVVLRRLEDARRDGNTVLAVIDAAALSNDGAGHHALAPAPEGQRECYDLAYAGAGFDPTEIDYVECHATGTPLGDQAELTSLETFFGESLPLLGSVKGNIGHLLTAAGITSLIKVVLALGAGTIPPTIGAEPAAPWLHDRVVRTVTQWPRRGSRRRAAVSAFGFGGANAHVVVAEDAPSADETQTPRDERLSAHIVGIGAYLAGGAGLDEVRRAEWNGGRPWTTAATGATVDSADAPADVAGTGSTLVGGAALGPVPVNPIRDRVPPRDTLNMNPLPQALWHAVRAAVADAALPDAPRRRVAVVVALDLDARAHEHLARLRADELVEEMFGPLSEEEAEEVCARLRDAVHAPLSANEVLSFIGSIAAARISSLADLTGPSFTVSAGALGVVRAIEAAQLLLGDPTVEAVVVAAIDHSVTAERSLLPDASDMPVDGAVALVVARGPGGRGSYAVIEDAGSAPSHPRPSGLSAPDCVDLHAMTRASRESIVRQVLDRARPGHAPVLCATREDWGDAGNAAGALMLLRAVLAVHHRVRPSSPLSRTLPEDLRQALAAGGGGAAAAGSPWLVEPGRHRRAAIEVAGHRGAHGRIQVVEPDGRRRAVDPAAAWAAAGGPSVVLVEAADRAGLVARLRILAESVPVHELAPATGPERIVLVARNAEALVREARSAADRIASTTENRWASPAGSRYRRLSSSGAPRTAFAYPGAFTAFPGYGSELLRAIPAAADALEAVLAAGAESFDLQRLYPGPDVASEPEELLRYEQDMVADVPFMLGVGTTFSLVYTDVYRDLLGIEPVATIGYSLGSSSMLFATGVWDRAGRRLRRIAASPVFQDELAGSLLTVRRYFGVEDGTCPIWRAVVVLAPVEDVRAAIVGFDDVFVTHVNTPRESVVSGAPAAVADLLDRTGFRWAPSPVVSPLHAPPAELWSDELVALHRFPLGQGTCAAALDPITAGPLPHDAASEDLAERIGRSVVEPVDFPRLVRAAAERADLLLEAGPGGTCARWAADSVSGLITAAPDRRGAPLTSTWATLLAVLVVEGVDLDLTPYAPVEIPARATTFVGTVRPIREAVAKALRPVLKAQDAAREIPEETMSEPSTAASPAFPIWDARGAALQGWWQPTSAVVASPVPAAPPSTEMVQSREHASLQPSVDERAVSVQARSARPGAYEIIMDARARIATQTLEAHTAALRLQHLYLVGAVRDLAPDAPRTRCDVVFDEADLLEFAVGSVGRVFGPDYAPLDNLALRVRLPGPPYHFVSRVTHLEGERGRFERSSITTEYDVPEDAWFAVDGGVPPAVAIEAGQADLLLVAWLGIDFENAGRRAYRLLDSTLVFHGDLPRTKQTLRYEIVIDRFVRNGPSVLFYFRYQCFADDELILELTRATAGFFSAKELAEPLGIVGGPAPAVAPAEGPDRPWLKPVARTDHHDLDDHDLALLSAGDPGAVFGPEHRQPPGTNPALRLPDQRLRMIHDVRVEPGGGTRRLGRVVAHLPLDSEAWYFTSHFPDDPVLAGSLVAEGAVQSLQVLLLHHGFHLLLPDARFQTVRGLETEVSVRGQIVPGDSELRYELDVQDLTLLPRPTVVADVLVYRDGQPVVRMRNFGVQIREKPGTEHRPGAGGVSPFLGRTTSRGVPAVVNELQLEHAAMGDLGEAMGPEFDVYEGRRAPHIPNRDFRFVDRIESVTGRRGQLTPGMTMITEYDAHADSWYYEEQLSMSMPHAVLLESSLQSAILLGYYQGATLAQPDVEFAIRNLDGTAELVRPQPAPGATIRQTSRLVFSSAVEGNVLQKFVYELDGGDGVFYRGESVFGYFSAAALESQIGLDGGERRGPSSMAADASAADLILDETGIEERYRARGDRLALPGGRLALLHELRITLRGGVGGLGSAWGRRRVSADDWYFTRHFHRDPVQPGSLGIEAMLQALQALTIELDLHRGVSNPVPGMATGVPTSWTYRGQVLRSDEECSVEVEITRVDRDADGVTVVAQGSLWKQDLRIYAVTGLALRVSGGPRPQDGPRQKDDV